MPLLLFSQVHIHNTAAEETQFAELRNERTAGTKLVGDARQSSQGRFSGGRSRHPVFPATKAQPKEMLPIVDKPIIQYGVEEALHSGIQNIIIVTGRGKSAIEDHFDVSFELEHLLETRGKKDLLAIVRNISDMINVSYVRQKEALGLGHAVLRAMELVGEEPFAVVLADDVIEAETPCLRQLLDIYDSSARPCSR